MTRANLVESARITELVLQARRAIKPAYPGVAPSAVTTKMRAALVLLARLKADVMTCMQHRWWESN